MATLLASSLSAQPDSEALPVPLSLEQALALGQENNPEVLLAHSRQAAAAARRLQVQSRYGTRISLLAQARAVDPSPLGSSLYSSHNDSATQLRLRRRLYDFGHTEALAAAATAALQGQEHVLLQVQLERRWQVLARFLAVILSDLTVQAREEAMVTAYVAADRGRIRTQLGQLSEVDYLALETIYQRLRAETYEARAEQRRSRSQLAMALNRPGTLPTRLLRPAFPGNGRAIPELSILESQVLIQNPGLLSRRGRLDAARQQLEAARASGRPILRGTLTASDYQRQGSGDDDLEAELALEIPLSSGGKVAADTALAQSEVLAASAELQQDEWGLRQELYDLLQEIQVLQDQQKDLRAEVEYRDLTLDRSRVLYEMEVKSDLGDAMAQFTALRLHEAQIEFDLALAWARLAVITANSRWDPLDARNHE